MVLQELASNSYAASVGVVKRHTVNGDNKGSEEGLYLQTAAYLTSKILEMEGKMESYCSTIAEYEEENEELKKEVDSLKSELKFSKDMTEYHQTLITTYEHQITSLQKQNKDNSELVGLYEKYCSKLEEEKKVAESTSFCLPKRVDSTMWDSFDKTVLKLTTENKEAFDKLVEPDTNSRSSFSSEAEEFCKHSPSFESAGLSSLNPNAPEFSMIDCPPDQIVKCPREKKARTSVCSSTGSSPQARSQNGRAHLARCGASNLKSILLPSSNTRYSQGYSQRQTSFIESFFPQRHKFYPPPGMRRPSNQTTLYNRKNKMYSRSSFENKSVNSIGHIRSVNSIGHMAFEGQHKKGVGEENHRELCLDIMNSTLEFGRHESENSQGKGSSEELSSEHSQNQSDFSVSKNEEYETKNHKSVGIIKPRGFEAISKSQGYRATSKSRGYEASNQDLKLSDGQFERTQTGGYGSVEEKTPVNKQVYKPLQKSTATKKWQELGITFEAPSIQKNVQGETWFSFKVNCPCQEKTSRNMEVTPAKKCVREKQTTKTSQNVPVTTRIKGPGKSRSARKRANKRRRNREIAKKLKKQGKINLSSV